MVANVSYDYAKSDGSTAVSADYAQGIGSLGSYRSYSQEAKGKLLETYFNYTKKIDAIATNVDVIGGYSYQDKHEITPIAPLITEIKKQAIQLRVIIKELWNHIMREVFYHC